MTDPKSMKVPIRGIAFSNDNVQAPEGQIIISDEEYDVEDLTLEDIQGAIVEKTKTTVGIPLVLSLEISSSRLRFCRNETPKQAASQAPSDYGEWKALSSSTTLRQALKLHKENLSRYERTTSKKKLEVLLLPAMEKSVNSVKILIKKGD